MLSYRIYFGGNRMNELIENKKKSEILAEKIAAMDYGTVLLHSEIEAIIQEKHGTAKYASEISKTKKIILKQYHKVIESVIGDGYRIIEPDCFIDHSLKHYKKGFNELQKGVDTLSNAPVKNMTTEGRQAFRRVYDRSVILAASMQGARAEIKALAKRQSSFDPELIGRR